MTKNFIPILAIFLVVLVAFVALQIVSTLTNDKIPAPTQKQIEELNPKLDSKLLETLKTLPSN